MDWIGCKQLRVEIIEAAVTSHDVELLLLWLFWLLQTIVATLDQSWREG